MIGHRNILPCPNRILPCRLPRRHFPLIWGNNAQVKFSSLLGHSSTDGQLNQVVIYMPSASFSHDCPGLPSGFALDNLLGHCYNGTISWDALLMLSFNPYFCSLFSEIKEQTLEEGNYSSLVGEELKTVGYI